MSDQNHVSDWSAYFKALGPAVPYSVEQLVGGTIPGSHPSIVFGSDLPLSYLSVPEGSDIFDIAKRLHESNGGAEMWVFLSTGTAPWHCPAVVSQVNAKGKKGKI